MNFQDNNDDNEDNNDQSDLWLSSQSELYSKKRKLKEEIDYICLLELEPQKTLTTVAQMIESFPFERNDKELSSTSYEPETKQPRNRYLSLFGQSEINHSTVDSYVFEDAIDPERIKLHSQINFSDLKLPIRSHSDYSTMFDMFKKPTEVKSQKIIETLSKNHQEEIFQVIQKTFQDTPEFHSEYASVVRLILANQIPDRDYCKRLNYKYFPELSTEDGLKFRRTNEIIKCTCTLMLFFVPSYVKQHVISRQTFFEKYPQLNDQPEEEKSLLIKFCNAMRMALVLVPSSQNKGLLLNIGARLEGSGKEYIVGSGQKIETSNRVLIYETEGKISIRHRTPRYLQHRKHDDDYVLHQEYLERIHSRALQTFNDHNNNSNNK